MNGVHYICSALNLHRFGYFVHWRRIVLPENDYPGEDTECEVAFDDPAMAAEFIHGLMKESINSEITVRCPDRTTIAF